MKPVAAKPAADAGGSYFTILVCALLRMNGFRTRDGSLSGSSISLVSGAETERFKSFHKNVFFALMSSGQLSLREEGGLHPRACTVNSLNR